MCSQRQCHGSSPKLVGRKMSASRVPVQRSHAEPPGRECIQVQPSPPNHRGSKNAVRPSDWSSTSLSHGAEQAYPVVDGVGAGLARSSIQRRVGDMPGSQREEKEERDKSEQYPEKHVQRAASRRRQNNGDRFHGFCAPALGSAQESAASEPKERTKSPRAASIIRARVGHSGQKTGWGNLGVDPPGREV